MNRMKEDNSECVEIESSNVEYRCSDDGKVKVAACISGRDVYERVKADINKYKWNDSDYLLATYPTNGTHFAWEVMTMLLQGSADYITHPKEVLMIDLFPVSRSEKDFPSPRVLNTHYRTDVLPAEFRKAKTVIVLRNPKDTFVSLYFHNKFLNPLFNPDKSTALASLKLEDFLQIFLYNKDIDYGSYFTYTEYMWSRRAEPNVLVIFYEDLKLHSAATIHKINEFMGMNRSPELVQRIAEATDFKKMKQAKMEAKPSESVEEVLEQGNLLVRSVYSLLSILVTKKTDRRLQSGCIEKVALETGKTISLLLKMNNLMPS
ncbi:sulfotransferase 1A1-like isoform X2 [Watersipora subatra]|uniref:sulfotransferase 1A1-like isoform X2 n=1 Tax=Watersipora subatra TaxID=2589382 RepID=UPI00355AD59E